MHYKQKLATLHEQVKAQEISDSLACEIVQKWLGIRITQGECPMLKSAIRQWVGARRRPF